MLTPLKQSEVWFVTGSQHLYGPETLKQVADNSRTIAKALDGRRAFRAGRLQARGEDAGGGRRAARRSERVARLRRPHPVDAHVLARRRCGSPGSRRSHKPFAAPPHAVQPRHAVGDDRHGLHEPEPGRPRRPRVRVHLQPAAARPQGGRRPLAGRGRPRRGSASGCARRCAWHDCAGRQARPLRRQHARGGRHRGRQGRRPDAVRLRGERLRRRRPGGADRDEVDATPTSTACAGVRDELRRGQGAATRRQIGALAARRRPHRARPARVPRGRRLQRRSPTPSKTCTASSSCPASRRSG